MPKPSKPKLGPSPQDAPPKAQRGQRGITDMQKRFCEARATGLTNLEAMREAGSKATDAGAMSLASKWLKLDKVLTYLKSIPAVAQADAVDEAARQGRIATAQERQEFWTEVMRGRGMATFVTKEGLDSGPPDWGSRIRAAEALAKAQGDFKDDDQGKSPPQVIINLPQRAMTHEEI